MSLKRDEWLEPAIGLATIMFACVPAVRVFGMAFDGAANAFHFLALFIELATCALAWTAWRAFPQSAEVQKT